MVTGPPFDPAKTAAEIRQFIKTTLSQTGFTRLVVGVSGGVDSAVCCTLGLQTAGAENIFAGLFPYGTLPEGGQRDAKTLLEKLQVPPAHVQTVDIKPLVDPIFQKDPSMGDIRQGNVMARMRMLLLFDMAKKYNTLVLGTENKTEHLFGYFTRFGDAASDIEPIVGLYKTQVRQLAEYLDIPPQIVKKEPTAGLWHGQTDEGEFGFTYQDADSILYLYFDKRFSTEQIIQEGFSAHTVKKVLDRVEKNAFKRKLPYTLSDA